MSLRIRSARPADLVAVSHIEEESFPSPYPPDLFSKLLQDHGDSFFVAEDISGEVVGYCIASRERGLGHLISIAVLQEHRRKGLGTALLQFLTDYLVRKDVSELWLEVNVENKETIKLYERFGFAGVMILENYYSDGASALRMRLDLNKNAPRADGKEE